MWSVLLLWVCAAPQAPQAPAARPTPPAVELHAGTFSAVVRAVVPTEAELAWRTIPWRATLREGVADATAARRPILLWAMNGHPLGAT